MSALAWVRLTSPPRWALVATIAVGLLLLGAFADSENQHAPDLGLTAASVDGRLVVNWVQPAGWAWDAGVRPGDVVVEVDGHAPLAQAGTDSLASAQHVRVDSARTGAVHEVPGADPPVPQTRAERLRYLLIAGAFFAIGGSVFLLASDVGTPAVVLGLATSAAAMLITPTASTSGADWVVPVEITSLLAFGTLTLLLFLVFPVNRLRGTLGRLMAGVSVGTAVVLIGLFAWVATAAPGAYGVVQRGIFAHLVATTLGSIVLLIVALVDQSPERRAAGHALRLLALGTAAGLAPFGLLSLLPDLVGCGYLVPPDISILTIVCLPASLGAAVLSRQFLGIERLLRRGLVSLVVWVALLSVSGLVAWSVNFPLLSIAVTAGIFSVVERPLRRKIEGLLFRDVYDAREVVQAMGNEIVLLTGLEPIATSVLGRLGRTLDLSWATLSLDSEDRLTFTWGVPDGRQGTLVPLVTDNLEIGRLLAGPKRQDVDLLPRDHELLCTLAPLVATAIRSAVLTRRLEDQVVKLVDREVELGALSGRLMQVQEEERRRLALDLHDDPLQRAVLLARALRSAPESADTSRWREATEEIIVSLRALCQGLRPRTLDDFGLEPGLEWLLIDVGARSELAAHLEVSTDDGLPFGRLESDLEVALYRVAQEAVNNAVKHAEASALRVELVRERDQVHLRIADDGRGLPAVASGRGAPSTQLGLLGMRERIAPWGGLVTAGPAEHGGTLISATVRTRVRAQPHAVGVAA